ncbi:hypothetical protein E5Q_06156 [Mixia osmundae IAM 14324]|uniref:HORMA domain-containing protein n=1 Tax=Mixia osmundae (strain CBS 9802 / IAM 14324 / JCM 22182 / KY 12970) TaxID=764103 RepID=G7E9Y8_MIXOS|nr:hypothetical protein E5Q_06156 [Mixia osmundae IAM 14324]
MPPKRRAASTVVEEDTLNFKETLSVLKDFFEVALHQILYLRQVYPRDFFTKRKKYEVDVWQCHVPVLSEYVLGIVNSTADELSKEQVSQLIVSIQDNATHESLENYIFDVQYFPTVDRVNRSPAGISKDEIEDYMRAYIMSLSTIESRVQTGLPEDLTFTTFLTLVEPGEGPPTSEEERKKDLTSKWVPAQRQVEPVRADPSAPITVIDSSQDTVSSVSERNKLTPLKSYALGPLALQLFVEETAEKARLLQKLRTRDGALSSSAPTVVDKGKRRAVD